jgi:hypothetical protein
LMGHRGDPSGMHPVHLRSPISGAAAFRQSRRRQNTASAAIDADVIAPVVERRRRCRPRPISPRT